MRRSSLFLLPFVLALAAAPGRAQESQAAADQQSAQAAATQRKIEEEKALQAAAEMKQVELQRVTLAMQGLDKMTVELRAASSGMLGPVVTGAPYSATTTSESIQTLVDGNRIVHRSTYNFARDAQGRVRREEVSDAGAIVSVMIMDPVANATYMLDPAERTVRKTVLMVRREKVLAAAREGVTKSLAAVKREAGTSLEARGRMTTGGSFVYGGSTYVTVEPATQKMQVRRETLGTQDFEGVAADGSRTVSTIPAGQIGNERPIDIVSEQWYSKDLQTTVMSRHSDPRTGETTYRVTNIRRGDPDPSLFQVPGDYTMKDSLGDAVTRIVK